MEIRPTGNRVSVEVDEQCAETKSGIVLAPATKEKQNTGKVVAVGPSVATVNVGDKVIFNKYAGTEMVLGGAKRLVLSESDIVAVVSD